MAKEIEIPEVPRSRLEQYLTKIVKSLAGDGTSEDVELPKQIYSRVEAYLKAIIGLLAEVALGETFTSEEKEKLKSITNPINVKGTCDSYDDLESKTDAKVGDMWFVKGENGEDKSKEYVYTEDKKWDLVGDNSIDLTNYVKDTDYASSDKAGIIKNVGANKSGIDIDEQGNISIAHPDNVSELDTSSQKHTALTLDRVTKVAEYYGLSDQNTLKNDYVKNTQIVTNGTNTSPNIGLVKLGEAETDGLLVNDDGVLMIKEATRTAIKNETNNHTPLCPTSIKTMMTNYGLESKTYLKDTYQRKDEHASTTQYGNIMLCGEYAGLALSSDGKLELAGVTPTEIKKETSSVRKALVPMSIPVFMNNYGITNKGWCHEIKKKVESSRTTNENGICVTQNCIVLVAGCSNVVDGVSVTVVPFLNKDNLNNTSLIFKNTKTDELLKSTEITNLTYYYIEPFDEVTDPQSDEPSISEQPSISEEPTVASNSIESQSFTKSETLQTPSYSDKTFSTFAKDGKVYG